MPPGPSYFRTPASTATPKDKRCGCKREAPWMHRMERRIRATRARTHVHDALIACGVRAPRAYTSVPWGTNRSASYSQPQSQSFVVADGGHAVRRSRRQQWRRWRGKDCQSTGGDGGGGEGGQSTAQAATGDGLFTAGGVLQTNGSAELNYPHRVSCKFSRFQVQSVSSQVPSPPKSCRHGASAHHA